MSSPNKRLVVNIRGANASGKTTLVRRFLQAGAESISQTRALAPGDGTMVDFYRLAIPGLARPIQVIGKYDDSKYSGCDKIKSVTAIRWAVEHAAQDETAHTLFEGFYVSKSYAPYADLRNKLVSEFDLRWLWVFMNAPLGLVVERSEARRTPTSRPIVVKELAAVVRQMNNTRTAVGFNWPEDKLDLDPSGSTEELYTQLVNSMARAEKGENLHDVI